MDIFTMRDEIMRQLNVLSDLAPEDVPKASQFFLEISFSELSTSNLETQKILNAGGGRGSQG